MKMFEVNKNNCSLKDKNLNFKSNAIFEQIDLFYQTKVSIYNKQNKFDKINGLLGIREMIIQDVMMFLNERETDCSLIFIFIEDYLTIYECVSDCVMCDEKLNINMENGLIL